MSWTEAALMALALAGVVGVLFSAASWFVPAKLMQQLTEQRSEIARISKPSVESVK